MGILEKIEDKTRINFDIIGELLFINHCDGYGDNASYPLTKIEALRFVDELTEIINQIPQ